MLQVHLGFQAGLGARKGSTDARSGVLEASYASPSSKLVATTSGSQYAGSPRRENKRFRFEEKTCPATSASFRLFISISPSHRLRWDGSSLGREVTFKVSLDNELFELAVESRCLVERFAAREHHERHAPHSKHVYLHPVVRLDQ